MTTELLQAFKDMTPFAIGAVVLLVAIWKLAPIFQSMAVADAASNDRLAKAYTRLSDSLDAVSKESGANAKAIGSLADTTSLTGLSAASALDKIAQGLDTAMQRQRESIDMQKQSSDVGTQTLTKTTTIATEIGGMKDMVEQILSKVLDLGDAVKGLNHPTTMTLEDWKPLDDKLAELKHHILDAIARSKTSQALPSDAPMFTDVHNPNGSTTIESETIEGNVPPEVTDKKD